MKKTSQWKLKIGLYVPLAVIVIMIIAGIAAPYIAPHDPVAVDLSHQLEGMSRSYPMGTDKLGRCIFSRCLYGIRSSVGLSLLISSIGVGMGILIGVISGYVGGVLDTVVMRIVDSLMAFPKLILVLVLVGIMGGGTYQIIIAMLLVHWVWYARITRSMSISLREHNYVAAAKGLLGLHNAAQSDHLAVAAAQSRCRQTHGRACAAAVKAAGDLVTGINSGSFCLAHFLSLRF